MNRLSIGLVWSALIAFVGPGAGCVAAGADAGDDGDTLVLEPIGTSQQALTTSWKFSKQTTTAASYTLVGPTATGSTCFLTGIYGALKGDVLGTTSKAIAQVLQSTTTNTWTLTINPGTGDGLRVDGLCINRPMDLSSPHSWYSTQPISTTTWPVTPGNYCFLNQVYAQSGFGGMYNGQITAIGLYKSGNTWVMSGNLNPQQDWNPSGGAMAVCVDIPTTASGDGIWWAPLGSGLLTYPLVPNSGLTVGCGLRTIGGNFSAASLSNNPRDGAGIEYINNGWTMNARDTKGIDVTCVTYQ